ncbi:MAG: SGNH/GDSL hydrolase family protein [Armatimonadetes bacterium]|nr:SGNH/GDSL hydrolase family protein [Armatimonadota bacterium]
MAELAPVLMAYLFGLVLYCAAQADDGLTWYDATSIQIEGKGWQDTESFFDRFPARALDQVNDDLKGLARLSPGMAIRFVTDSGTLTARWSLGDDAYVMTHMAATGTSGLDLYVKAGDGSWAYTGTGRPEDKRDNEATFFSNRPKAERTYLLYLPLFNRLTSLSIGVTAGSSFETVQSGAGKTVVFYGTSIVHGGCASRPGMAYPAIIGRALDCETVNLGFSGSARMEPVVCDLLAELDPDVFVIDALPNMGSDPITERTLNLVGTIRESRPSTPIILVENITCQTGPALGSDGSYERGINAQLRAAYEQLLVERQTRLHYLEGANLLGTDGEGTVDGTHPTDLGFSRMAQIIGPVVAAELE